MYVWATWVAVAAHIWPCACETCVRLSPLVAIPPSGQAAGRAGQAAPQSSPSGIGPIFCGARIPPTLTARDRSTDRRRRRAGPEADAGVTGGAAGAVEGGQPGPGPRRDPVITGGGQRDEPVEVQRAQHEPGAALAVVELARDRLRRDHRHPAGDAALVQHVVAGAGPVRGADQAHVLMRHRDRGVRLPLASSGQALLQRVLPEREFLRAVEDTAAEAGQRQGRSGNSS